MCPLHKIYFKLKFENWLLLNISGTIYTQFLKLFFFRAKECKIFSVLFSYLSLLMLFICVSHRCYSKRGRNVYVARAQKRARHVRNVAAVLLAHLFYNTSSTIYMFSSVFRNTYTDVRIYKLHHNSTQKYNTATAATATA